MRVERMMLAPVVLCAVVANLPNFTELLEEIGPPPGIDKDGKVDAAIDGEQKEGIQDLEDVVKEGDPDDIIKLHKEIQADEKLHRPPPRGNVLNAMLGESNVTIAEQTLRAGMEMLHPEWMAQALRNRPRKEANDIMAVMRFLRPKAEKPLMQYMDKGLGCLRTKCEKEMDTCAQKHEECKRRVDCLLNTANPHAKDCWVALDDDPSPEETVVMECMSRCTPFDNTTFGMLPEPKASFLETVHKHAAETSSEPSGEDLVRAFSEDEQIRAIERHDPGLTAEDERLFHDAFQKGRAIEKKQLDKFAGRKHKHLRT